VVGRDKGEQRVLPGLGGELAAELAQPQLRPAGPLGYQRHHQVPGVQTITRPECSHACPDKWLAPVASGNRSGSPEPNAKENGMTHSQTPAERSARATGTFAVLGAGGTMGFAMARNVAGASTDWTCRCWT
jgi:hypothetical protein